MRGPRLETEGVTRRFGELVAVDHASVALAPGEIHALVGENGAGKSTLLGLFAGALAPSSGVVRVDGTELRPATPAEAIRRGVGMVHQHFMLVGAFSALDNLVLGAEPTRRGGVLDRAAALARARALAESVGLEVPLERRTDELTVGERQRLEILRVLFRGAGAILLDEPTAVLSPLEADELYATLRKLADDGATIAVVTHRLDEVVRFADRVTVLRRGRVMLAERAPSRGSAIDARAREEALTRAIMGGDPPRPFTPPPLLEGAEPVLEVRDLSLANDDGRACLSDIDLVVRSGEIVGIAGVEGNGQRELVRALAGLEPRARGRVAIAGSPLEGPPARRRDRLGVVHEDRHEDGLVLEATVADNLVLGDLGRADLDERATMTRRLERYGVAPKDPERLASELSGGNQQKIVVARAVDRLLGAGSRGALVLAQPTRGVDVGAAATIHRAIGQAAAAGLAIVIVSADLSELRRLSHRLLVLRRGRFVAELPPDASDDAVGRAMLGMEAA
jgi:simple sugar transport system ATP-binding protein